jgi:hypothetical protein
MTVGVALVVLERRHCSVALTAFKSQQEKSATLAATGKRQVELELIPGSMEQSLFYILFKAILTEERLFLNKNEALALKIQFFCIFYNLTLSTLLYFCKLSVKVV